MPNVSILKTATFRLVQVTYSRITGNNCMKEYLLEAFGKEPVVEGKFDGAKVLLCPRFHNTLSCAHIPSTLPHSLFPSHKHIRQTITCPCSESRTLFHSVRSRFCRKSSPQVRKRMWFLSCRESAIHVRDSVPSLRPSENHATTFIPTLFLLQPIC